MTVCFWAPGVSTGYVFEDIIMFRCVCESQDLTKSYFRSWASRSQCLWFSIWKWQYSYVAKTLVTNKYKLLQELHCFLHLSPGSVWNLVSGEELSVLKSQEKVKWFPHSESWQMTADHCSLSFPVTFFHFPFMPSVSFICPHSLLKMLFYFLADDSHRNPLHSFTDICLTVM